MKSSWLIQWVYMSVFGSLLKSSAPMKLLQFSLLILTCITCSHSGFTIFPTPQVVPSEAQEAIFYCRYPTAHSIGWRVDGNSLGRAPRVGITPCTDPRLDGVVIDRLKVEVDPDHTHNGIIVECTAFFIGRPVTISEPANLTIKADATFEMGFTISPYSQYENITDSELVLAAGETAVFQCQYCVTEDISWIINGEILDELNIPANVTVVRDYDVRPYCGPLHTLRVTNISTNYNQSIIQCAPEEGLSDEVSTAISLWVQGALRPIQSIRKIPSDTYSIFEWTAPFSLNLTGIDPSIVYCVSIYDITCLNQRDLIFEDRNCSTTYPSYSTPFGKLNSAKRFEVTVIPKLNSVNALNDTMPTKYEDQFLHLNATAVMLNLTIHVSSNISTARVQLEGELNLEDTDPLKIRPEGYAMELNGIETGNQGHTIRCPLITGSSNLTANSTTFPWTLNCSSPILTMRLFICKVFAFMMKPECYVPISSAIELSTHIIQNIRVSSTIHHGELVVHADFIRTNITTSLGYMAIVYSNHSDIHYKVALRQYDQSNADVKFSGLPGNTYKVSVFNIEPDGLPFTNSASLSKNESIIGATDIQQDQTDTDSALHIEYMHQSNNYCCVRCIFSNSSIKFCLFVTIEKSQLATESWFGLLDIETREVENNTEECLQNCIERVTVAFVYSSDFGMITGSGVEITFPNDKTFTDQNDLPLDEQQLSRNVAVGVSTAVILAAILALAVIVSLLALLFRKKRGHAEVVRISHAKVVRITVQPCTLSHSRKDDTDGLINSWTTEFDT